LFAGKVLWRPDKFPQNHGFYGGVLWQKPIKLSEEDKRTNAAQPSNITPASK
jgi:hypothetical protein